MTTVPQRVPDFGIGDENPNACACCGGNDCSQWRCPDCKGCELFCYHLDRGPRAVIPRRKETRMPNSEKPLGQLAYEAYGNVVDWKNYQGLPMPQWRDLGAHIQEAWTAAALEVQAHS